MLPDKLQKSFIWGRSFLMAAAKADNHAGSFLPFVCAWNGGSFRRNADTDLSRSDRCFRLRLVELADGSFKIQMGMQHLFSFNWM